MAKRREINITCPTGLTGTIGALVGDDLNAFANKQVAKRRKLGDKILGSCWLKTLDVGPAYEFEADGPPDFPQVATCDRFYATLMIRVMTRGEVFSFHVKCDECTKRYEWDLNLLTDVDVFSMPESSIENFRGENRFTVDLEGESVVFKIARGVDQTSAEKALEMSPTEQATVSIIQRVVGVTTDDGEVLAEGNAIHDWAKALSAESIFELIDLMDQSDGGVETEYTTECPHCGDPKDIQIPFHSGAFWAPPKRKPSERRKARPRNLV